MLLQMLILLAMAKLQEHVYEESSRAWQWAAAYAAVVVVLSLLAGGSLVGTLIGAALWGLYAWGYFALLRQVTDQLLLWLLVMVGGAVLPLLLVLKAMGAE